MKLKKPKMFGMAKPKKMGIKKPSINQFKEGDGPIPTNALPKMKRKRKGLGEMSMGEFSEARNKG